MELTSVPISESLVGTNLKVLRVQSAAWKSSDFLHLIREKMACIPMAGESSTVYQDKGTVTGYAELYGGAGVGANAGGVRSANIGHCQVKGIGPTILAGRSTDKWHKHGALSLQDAVKEAIFSELFHLALPHGASRPIAIYDLGVRFATEIGVEKKPSSAPRALFVREPIVRLAHFMRSSFMNVSDEIAERELPRMRAMVPKLVDHICAEVGEPSLEIAEVGLERLYSRVLEQTIAMRLKRLVHGSMIPSNFGVDGRLVDFTTSTAISSLQPVVVSLGSACSQTQHKQVLDTVADMVFYVTKFDPRCSANRQQIERVTKNIIDTANRAYENKVMLGHLQLIGLSPAEQLALSPEVRDRLIRAIVKIILQGSTEGHLYYGGDEHPMLPTTGRNDLCGALLGAVAWRGCEDGFVLSGVAQTCEAFSSTSINELRNAYNEACIQLEAEGLGTYELRYSHFIRTMQMHADLSGLYRRQIDGEINELCSSAGDVSAFVEAKLARWSNQVRYSHTGEVQLSGWLTKDDYRLTETNTLRLHGNAADFAHMFHGANLRALPNQYEWLGPALTSIARRAS
jgi:hypothetical protein